MKNLLGKFLYLFLVVSFLLSACSWKVQDSTEPAVIDTADSQPLETVTKTLVSTEAASATPVVTAKPTETSAPTAAVSVSFAAGEQLTGEDGATLVFVPAGEFAMGADADDLLGACSALRSDCRREWFTNVEPEREVTLDAFWIDETEVTNKTYKSCVDSGVCPPPFQSNSYSRENYFGNPEYDDYPVVYVSWENAFAYCEWAGRRLPTEAEWEKAARGDDGRVYPWGNAPQTKDLANYGLIVGDTTAVKSYPTGVSPFGAYDMAGNAWEWVNDWYDKDYYKTAPAVNPMGSVAGRDKVSRGGAWIFYDFDMLITDRYGNFPTTTNNVIGFRCAKTP